MSRPSPRRSAACDTIRGAALASMTVYHASWDLVYIFGVNWPFYHTFGAYLWQQSICWTFVLLSGYCVCFGRHPLRRGGEVFLCGAVVTAATSLAVPENRVLFGVLTLLGSAMVLWGLLRPWLERLPPRAGLAGSFLLFLFTRDVNAGYLGFEGAELCRLPAGRRNLLTAYFGFPGPEFFSTDYFSLLPWVFLFFTGYFLHVLAPQAEEGRGGFRLPLLTAMGRHSLEIYMLHQVVIYALLSLWNLLRTG